MLMALTPPTSYKLVILLKLGKIFSLLIIYIPLKLMKLELPSSQVMKSAKISKVLLLLTTTISPLLTPQLESFSIHTQEIKSRKLTSLILMF
jgi:hypothetical protein